jgi:ABC-type dipeptide/oligopeptide/nickel transport system permease subunit
VPPGVLIAMLVLSFTLIGNALTEVLDPRQGKR